MLMGSPIFPSDHRAFGNDAGSCSFLTVTQVMQMAYDAIKEESWRLKIALKAAEEPRLINESNVVQASVMIVALTGICTVLFIREIQLENGSPSTENVYGQLDPE